jgi:SAM-dependent methyltransferase
MNTSEPAESSLLPSSDVAWRPEYRPCPVCGSEWRKTIGARGGDAQREKKGEKTYIVRCRVCTLLYTFPRMLPLINPYSAPDEYFAGHDSEQKIKFGEAISREAETILGHSGSILELGCGRGEFLIGARRAGWQVSGVEMTAEFARHAESAGVSVERATIEECETLNRADAFDAIVLAAVLEHLYEPLDVLRRAFHALRPGGLLYIEVPDELSLAMRVGNLYMRLRGRRWSINLSPTFPPYHVVGFSPSSLHYALSSVGFITHRMLSMNYDLSAGNAFERRMLSLIQSIGLRLNMGDAIQCWAIKPSY